MDRSIALRGLGTLVLCVAAAGCASVAPVLYSEMASSAYMAPDKSDASGRVPYRYSTQVDWRAYNKVILDPVVVYRGRDHQFGDMSDKDKATSTDPSGTWLVEDGRTRIRLERCGPSRDRICGFIVWMKEPVDKRGQPYRDSQNPDPDKRARMLLGHQLIMGLQATPEGRFAGDIYNAEDGKSYSVSLWRESPDRLKLRGCLIKILCQTQTWQQTLDVLPGQLVGLTGDLNGPRADKEWAQVPAPKPTPVKGK